MIRFYALTPTKAVVGATVARGASELEIQDAVAGALYGIADEALIVAVDTKSGKMVAEIQADADEGWDAFVAKIRGV